MHLPRLFFADRFFQNKQLKWHTLSNAIVMDTYSYLFKTMNLLATLPAIHNLINLKKIDLLVVLQSLRVTNMKNKLNSKRN